MALTLEQENALLGLLDEPAVTLNELPRVQTVEDQDLFLTRQDTREKAVTGETLKDYFNGLNKDKNLSDVADKNAAIANLGLEERLYPVGAPIPWPSVNVPVGYIKCNGAAFDTVQYPKLAAAYPNGTLPDLRGEFIRGWDDGRGVDVGRFILSQQSDAMQPITGHIDGYFNFNYYSGAFIVGNIANGIQSIDRTQSGNHTFNFNSSRVVRTADETRPRNIAFLYIVKAA